MASLLVGFKICDTKTRGKNFIICKGLLITDCAKKKKEKIHTVNKFTV